jgi:hypothetical protein
MDDLVHCEFCQELVHLNIYDMHARRCEIMHMIQGGDSDGAGDADDGAGDADDGNNERDEDMDDDMDLNLLLSYITRNDQISGGNIRDFLITHHSPSQTSFMTTFHRSISMQRRISPVSPSLYDQNIALAERLGDVEIGIPDIEHVSSVIDVSSVDTSTVCVICQESLGGYERPLRTLHACMHHFCSTCIENWLKRKTRCPVCMHDLQKIEKLKEDIVL